MKKTKYDVIRANLVVLANIEKTKKELRRKKIIYFLKYNGFTVIGGLLISFTFEFLVLLLNEINWYFKWIAKTFKPSIRQSKIEYLKINQIRRGK